MEIDAPVVALPPSSTPAHTSQWPSTRPPPNRITQLLACPDFQYNLMNGRKPNCNGADEVNMSGVCLHLKRAHKQFTKLCKTCSEHFIDKDEFELFHGERCRTPRRLARSDAAKEEQWRSLFKKMFPEEERSISPCKRFHCLELLSYTNNYNIDNGIDDAQVGLVTSNDQSPSSILEPNATPTTYLQPTNSSGLFAAPSSFRNYVRYGFNTQVMSSFSWQ
jgi:hypothetical protein